MANYTSGIIDYGSVTTTATDTNAGDWICYDMADAVKKACQPIVSIPSVWMKPYYDYNSLKYLCPSSWAPLYQNKKGDDDMRYLYEVILVNPKDDEFEIFEVVAKSETAALIKAYKDSEFSNEHDELYDKVAFDDLKTHCRVLMEWKKEKSLEKALETIKKAVE